MQISWNPKDVGQEVLILIHIKSFGFENLSSRMVKDLFNFHRRIVLFLPQIQKTKTILIIICRYMISFVINDKKNTLV